MGRAVGSDLAGLQIDSVVLIVENLYSIQDFFLSSPLRNRLFTVITAHYGGELKPLDFY